MQTPVNLRNSQKSWCDAVGKHAVKEGREIRSAAAQFSTRYDRCHVIYCVFLHVQEESGIRYASSCVCKNTSQTIKLAFI